MIKVTDEMKKLVDDELGDIDTEYCHWGKYRDSTIKRIIELHEQSKPKPEPVGYVKTVGGYPDESEHGAEWVVKYKELKHGQPLYTTPPTQEPLTPEEIGKILFLCRKEQCFLIALLEISKKPTE